MDSGIRIGYNSLLVMFPAERNVALVAAELNLLSLCDHLPIQYPCIEVRPLAAPANRFDLLNVIRKLHKPLRTGEQMVLEVRPQTVADDAPIPDLIDKKEYDKIERKRRVRNERTKT